MTCGLDGAGAVSCWGPNSEQMRNPPATAFSEITVVVNSRPIGCGVPAAGGPVECW
ncbi:MAG: hypothetical protein JRI25_29470 [Deltaproteobacteria bacterium]|nr:hypothetical protein [Deltaproteobacteria bacterium]